MGGVWRCVAHDRMYDFCKANGMGFFMLNAANVMDFGKGEETETIEVKKKKDKKQNSPAQYTVKFTTQGGYKNPSFSVVSDKSSPQDVETAAGDKYSMRVYTEGEALITEGEGVTFRREIVNGKMVLSLTTKGVTATRTHEKQ